MIELIKFALENIANLIGVLCLLGFIFIFGVSVVSIFKPINYTYITNVKEDKEILE